MNEKQTAVRTDEIKIQMIIKKKKRIREKTKRNYIQNTE